MKRWAPAVILDLATGSGVLAHEIKRQIPAAHDRRSRLLCADADLLRAAGESPNWLSLMGWRSHFRMDGSMP